MYRRLYFLLPDREHALAVVNELAVNGIREEHMHAVADQRVRLTGLPNATTRQKHDAGRRVEKLLWNANLAVFALALGSFITLTILHGLSGWLLVCIAIMIATFLAGLGFIHQAAGHDSWLEASCQWGLGLEVEGDGLVWRISVHENGCQQQVVIVVVWLKLQGFS